VKATQEELAHLLANAAFLKPFGFVIQSCAPGECTIVAPYAASLERPGGILSGITIMGAAAECRAANGDLLAHHVLSYALVP
jgi:acyl-coenzyme A thioesterase PaaI-like protein